MFFCTNANKPLCNTTFFSFLERVKVIMKVRPRKCVKQRVGNNGCGFFAFGTYNLTRHTQTTTVSKTKVITFEV